MARLDGKRAVVTGGASGLGGVDCYRETWDRAIAVSLTAIFRGRHL